MDPLERYIHDFSEPEEALLHELDRETTCVPWPRE